MRRACAVWFALVLAALLVAGSAEAQQLDFFRDRQGTQERLSYRWRDHDKRVHSMSVALRREAVDAAEASFRDFSLEDMWQYVMDQVKDEVANFGHGARVDFQRSANGLSWKYTTRDQRSAPVLGKRIEARLAVAKNYYLSRHLRRQVGNKRVMVDFAAATVALQESMAPLARSIGKESEVSDADDDRARVGLSLSFFQAIPYARLEDKARQGGDFLPAPALLAENRGDCDSKAVALAAVLRSFVPGRKMAMVLMPGHAALGVDITPRAGDQTIRDHEQRYVVLEAAGPAMLPVGRVGTETAKYLTEGREIEIWPLD